MSPDTFEEYLEKQPPEALRPPPSKWPVPRLIAVTTRFNQPKESWSKTPQRMKTRIYVNILDKEEPESRIDANLPHAEFEKVWTARVRRYTESLQSLWPEIEALAGMGLRDGNRAPHWSRKAGCDCGCSPGFVANVHSDKSVNVDIRYGPDPTPEEVAADAAKADRQARQYAVQRAATDRDNAETEVMKAQAALDAARQKRDLAIVALDTAQKRWAEVQ